MPYTESHNILFIHIPKNAGKSIEVSLGIRSKSELMSSNHRGFLSRCFKYGIKLTARKRNLASLWGTWDYTLALQHCTLQEYALLGFLDTLPSKDFKTLAVIRNPFDRIVSTFYHFRNENEDINDFIERFFKSDTNNIDHNLKAHRRPQVDFLKDEQGIISIDYLLLFDDLAEYFNSKMKNLGYSIKELPHVTNTNRSSVKSLPKLSSKSKGFVEAYFKEDLNLYRRLKSSEK